jgi:hypothetical protein
MRSRPGPNARSQRLARIRRVESPSDPDGCGTILGGRGIEQAPCQLGRRTQKDFGLRHAGSAERSRSGRSRSRGDHPGTGIASCERPPCESLHPGVDTNLHRGDDSARRHRGLCRNREPRCLRPSLRTPRTRSSGPSASRRIAGILAATGGQGCHRTRRPFGFRPYPLPRGPGSGLVHTGPDQGSSCGGRAASPSTPPPGAAGLGAGTGYLRA